jgi:hypothetical protein
VTCSLSLLLGGLVLVVEVLLTSVERVADAIWSDELLRLFLRASPPSRGGYYCIQYAWLTSPKLFARDDRRSTAELQMGPVRLDVRNNEQWCHQVSPIKSNVR